MAVSAHARKLTAGQHCDAHARKLTAGQLCGELFELGSSLLEVLLLRDQLFSECGCVLLIESPRLFCGQLLSRLLLEVHPLV